MYVFEEGVGWTITGVNVGPFVQPAIEGFVFPKAESFLVNDSRLDNFAIWEDAPCYGVDVFILQVDVLFGIPRYIYNLVAHSLVQVQVLNQRNDKLFWDEELEIGLLVNVALCWTPAKYGIAGGGAVDAWL